MSFLVVQIAYGVVAVALVGGATWSFSRYSAPLLFDLLDTDELVVAATHRLLAVGHLLLGAAVAAALVPSGHPHPDAVSPLISSTAALLSVLGAGHLGLVALHLRARRARLDRELAANRAWMPPTTPPPHPVPPHPVPVQGALVPMPTVPMPRPVFAAPQAFYPPSPPPWCRPLPNSYDVWAPPPR